jgi:glycogen operon protein
VALRSVPTVTWHSTDVDGARTRWLEAGEGDPLVFLHGWGMTPRVYAPAVTPLCRAGIRVIAPALPGFGGTAGPSLRRVTVDAYAERVAAFVDALELDRPAFLMGHSLGGGVAIRLAAQRPDLVRSLTLVNSVGGAPGRRDGMKSGSWWRWAVGALGEVHPRALTPDVVIGVARDFLPNVVRSPFTSALSAYAALSADLAGDAQRLVDDGLPVLFVWGDRDRLITPGAFQEIANSMPPEVVAGRHGWLLTEPETFAALLHNALVVHAMLERSRRGQRVPSSGPLFPPERRTRARHGDAGYPRRTWPGRERPLGATWDGEGVNFAVFSQGAEAVDLCLFDESGAEHRIPLEETTNKVWHGYVAGVRPGQRYGFRVDGPFDPARGLRWNPAKLLLDPYARAVSGSLTLDDAIFGYPPGRDDLVQDHRDSAPYVPRSVVVHDAFPWGDDPRPQVPWADTVIYELHVKGFTKLHPGVPEPLRGTYAGLAHPAAIEHLKTLGVTAVELMPVHHFLSEPFVLRRGLTNYWGYNSAAYFAPHAAYSSSGDGGEQVGEFKAMVRALHAAGIEVILDVVYNHTAEGDETGPTLSLRGIDNPSYYKLTDGGRRYANYTGTGNTLNARDPHVLQLILDSLRYWVTEMHVDGFRFDLASSLARSFHAVDRLAAFFDLVQQDPVVSAVKLIAEPWDLGEGGYNVGQFPPLWTEWNGRYRDSVRDFWRGAAPPLSELGYRLSGSSDLYQDDGRHPYASINFVTAHDGFPLRDLVSYESKHNEANGEDNRDGTTDNRSANYGVEGPTADPTIVAVRQRQLRNFLTTLLLSSGVPMLTAGDELGRTQGGNNNPYCQDNEISWLNWSLEPWQTDLLAFARRVIALRRAHPVFRRRAFFTGRPAHGLGVKDLGWFGVTGVELTEADWSRPAVTLGVFVDGAEIHTRGPRGERIEDESFLLILHAGASPVGFTLPGDPWAKSYEVLLDTAGYEEWSFLPTAGTTLDVTARSVVLLRAHR